MASCKNLFFLYLLTDAPLPPVTPFSGRGGSALTDKIARNRYFAGRLSPPYPSSQMHPLPVAVPPAAALSSCGDEVAHLSKLGRVQPRLLGCGVDAQAAREGGRGGQQRG